MQTFIEKQERALRKKLHVLLGKAGVSEDNKRAIYASYGVASSTELNAYELMELCNRLAKDADPRLAELDRARKRLMAAIGGWMCGMGMLVNGDKIKAVACRAAQRERFNDIPMEQLRSLYAAFLKKQKDLERVERFTAEEAARLARLN